MPSTVTVQADQPIRPVADHALGLNLTFYDGNLNTPETAQLLTASGLSLFRISNGSGTEGNVHFDQPANERPGYAPGTTAQLLQAVQDFQGTGLVTVNYGSGGPQEAIAYVAYLNGQVGDMTPIGFGPQFGDPLYTTDYSARDWHTVDYWARLRSEAPRNDGSREDALRIGHPEPFHFHYWEVGNEQYFGPEYGPDGMAEDHHRYTRGATPTERADRYVTFARAFAGGAQAIDPNLSIGVDVGNPDVNDAGNPIAQWTLALMQACARQGYTPGFLSDHLYVFGPDVVSDATFLHSVDAPHPELTLDKGPTDWGTRAQMYQQDLGMLGAADQNVELLATEFNSYDSANTKQTTNLTNGLWYADSIGSILRTNYRAALFWDLRNAYTPMAPNPDLYGWREGGDEGLLGTFQGGDGTADTPARAGGPSNLDGANVRYPTYFAAQLVSHLAHGGDTVVQAGSDDTNLTAYAVQQANGHLALLLINKEAPSGAAEPKTVTIQIAGFIPTDTAHTWQYGTAEDNQQRDTGTSELTERMAVPLAIGQDGGRSTFSVRLSAYSMTVLDLTPTGEVMPQAPVLVQTAMANPHSLAVDAEAQLSVQATDVTGENHLTYSWTVAAGPAGATFSANDTNAAKQTAVRFTQPGTYEIRVTITNDSGRSITSEVQVDVHAAIDGGTAAGHFVQQVYRDLLGREAEPAGLKYWTNRVEQGDDRKDIVHEIEGSLEYRTREVEALYHRFLNRSSDADGLAQWVAALNQGTRLEEIETGFLGSQEYRDLRAGGTDASFLRTLYQELLDRDIDPTGFQAWSAALTTGAMTRSEVAVAVLNSLEGRRQVVENLYQELLERRADEVGIHYWPEFLTHGSQAELIAQIIASEEYFQRAGTPHG